MMIVYIVVPESPVFLYDKGNITEARRSLLLIAHNNGIKNTMKDGDDILDDMLRPEGEKLGTYDGGVFADCVNKTAAPDKVEEKKEADLRDLLGNPTHLRNLIICSITWSCSAFGAYMIAFELKYMPGSIYANATMSVVADMVGKPIGYCLL